MVEILKIIVATMMCYFGLLKTENFLGEEDSLSKSVVSFVSVALAVLSVLIASCTVKERLNISLQSHWSF